MPLQEQTLTSILYLHPDANADADANLFPTQDPYSILDDGSTWYFDEIWNSIEKFELEQEAQEDFYNQEFYSRIPSHKKTNAGWWNDYLDFKRFYNKRCENKKQIAEHRALRKARKETRSFERHREIDEATSDYLENLWIHWEEELAEDLVY